MVQDRLKALKNLDPNIFQQQEQRGNGTTALFCSTLFLSRFKVCFHGKSFE